MERPYTERMSPNLKKVEYKPIKEEMYSVPGWLDIPRNGGGDLDLADY